MEGKRTKGYWLLEVLVLFLMAAFAFALIMASNAEAIQIGPELGVEFAWCPTAEGFDADAGMCHGEPPSHATIEAQGSLTVWLDARPNGFTTLEHRIVETQVALVYESARFEAPEGVAGPTITPDDTWYCSEEPLTAELSRAMCFFRDAGGFFGEGMQITEAGAELGIRLEARADTGYTAIAFEPWPDSYYGHHQNELFGVIWTTNDPEDDEDPLLLWVGDWRRVGPPISAEILPAPEPSQALMFAAALPALVVMARRRR